MTAIDKLRNNINYAPYCCNCMTMSRMTKTDRGFICKPDKQDHHRRNGCGNSFEFDEEFLNELKSLGWENAIPKKELTASELDKIIRDLRRKKRKEGENE